MKNYEKETIKNSLEAEQKEMKRLQAIYKKAAQDVSNKIRLHNGKISVLLSQFDELDEQQKSILQSQIYQKQFQENLKKQLDDILKDLQDKQYKSISEYLKGTYEDGFTSAMYSIHKQGIPIVTPIDQKQVVRAMTIDSKISKGLYSRLGEDVARLKQRIANNISRGVAAADSYANIARNIANGSKIGFNNAMRITRTEGNRIANQAKFDASAKAKEKGADVLKQWDAALDGKTRDSHRRVDGEIRELEEKFSNGLMKPSDSNGEAAEVINCRCTMLQRARWALDEEELETLKERAKYFELDKTEDFNDFKKKYLKAAEDTKTPEERYSEINNKLEALKAERNEVELDAIINFNPESWSKTQVLNEQIKALENDLETVLLEMSKSADNWEAVLNIQSDDTLKSFSSKLLEVATDEELGALNLWSGETYADINRYMRFGDNVGEKTINAAKKIESVLDKITTHEELIVRRGTGTKHIFGKISGDWKNDPTVLIGQSFSDAGFVATTPLKEGGFSGIGANQAELFIRVPKGTHGAYIVEQAKNANEKEFLLQRGYSYRIIKAEYRANPYFPDEKDLKVWCEVILDE